MDLVLLVAALAFPWVAGRYPLFLLTQFLILSVFALSVDLIWGYAGILSFGQAFFFGLGAYLYTLLNIRVTGFDPLWASILVAIMVPGVLGILLGYFLFRAEITGPSFAIITLAIALAAEQAAVSLYNLTGGYNGISGIAPFRLTVSGGWSLIFSDQRASYYLALVLLIAVYVGLRRVIISPFGRVLAAIQDNPNKAESVGYNVPLSKAVAFGLAGALAGLSGMLYAPANGFISPPFLGFLFSTQVLIWVLVGGRGTLSGAILGTILIGYAEAILGSLLLTRIALVEGPLLVLSVLFLPQGIIGLLRARRRDGRWRTEVVGARGE